MIDEQSENLEVAPKEANMPKERIINSIRFIRGQRVILDADLAELYGVETKRLNEQVKRNSERFPPDFVFQLTQEEFANLRSQSATSSQNHGVSRFQIREDSPPAISGGCVPFTWLIPLLRISHSLCEKSSWEFSQSG